MDFDASGHLTPYAVLETSLADFEAVFVTGFPESLTRRRIFGRYLAYVEELRGIVGSGFVQWVDGSFVTRKVNPGDIDFLTLLEIDRYEKNREAIDALRMRRSEPNSVIDGYFLFIRPENHPQWHLYAADRDEWYRHFRWGRDDEQKGFVQLNF